jgi:hypothetical protein
LRGGSAADRARHCERIAQQKSAACARHCARNCATEERRLCACADCIAARIGGDSVTHRGPVPGRKRPLFSS